MVQLVVSLSSLPYGKFVVDFVNGMVCECCIFSLVHVFFHVRAELMRTYTLIVSAFLRNHFLNEVC